MSCGFVIMHPINVFFNSYMFQVHLHSIVIYWLQGLHKNAIMHITIVLSTSHDSRVSNNDDVQLNSFKQQTLAPQFTLISIM